jgi:hypothetical protein
LQLCHLQKNEWNLRPLGKWNKPSSERKISFLSYEESRLKIYV